MMNIKIIEMGDPIISYVSRISGITAFILLTLVVAFGLIMSSKSLLKFNFMSSPTALKTHRTIAWGGFLMVILHLSTFFFDDYIRLKIPEVIIPFLIKRNITSERGFNLSVPISLGILAFYIILSLVTTSELKKKAINLKIWRTIHYASFAAYTLFIIHGFTIGTDSREPWMMAIYIISLSLVLTLLFGRIFRKMLFYPKPRNDISNT